MGEAEELEKENFESSSRAKLTILQNKCNNPKKRNQSGNLKISSAQRDYKPVIKSSTSILQSSSIAALSSKFVNLSRKHFNMSTTVSSPLQAEPTKIEKLEAKLASFEESFEKEEKLRAKLRYLHFFENFHIDPAPASFACSQCKEVEVVRKEVINHPSSNSKGGAGTHQGSPHVTTNYKKEIEVQCMNQDTHKREWQEQEKSRQEVRQEIRREFNKQEQGRGRGRRGQERNQDIVRLHQGDFAVNTNPPRAQKAPAPEAASPPAREEREEEENVGKLLHGDMCKTCVRMSKLTGQVLPHSPNY